MSLIGRFLLSGFKARMAVGGALLRRRGDITLGAHTYGNPRVYAHPGARLSIGKYCSLAPRVVIFLGSEHRPDFVSMFPFNVLSTRFAAIPGHPSSRGDVRIGNDVWIGYGATILSGVTIGDGAVVGAGAIVSSAVPDYGIVAGNPARLIRSRFEPRIIERLKRVSWWDWPDEEVEASVPVLMSTDIEAFLELAERRSRSAAT